MPEPLMVSVPVACVKCGHEVRVETDVSEVEPRRKYTIEAQCPSCPAVPPFGAQPWIERKMKGAELLALAETPPPAGGTREE